MADCPHLRRQNRFLWATGALALGSCAAQLLWPDGPARTGVGNVSVFILFAFMAANSVPRVRAWFGWGRHTPLPDERDALIAAYSDAATLQLMQHWVMPLLVVGGLLLDPHNKPLTYTLIGVFTVILYAPKALARFYFNTRM